MEQIIGYVITFLLSVIALMLRQYSGKLDKHLQDYQDFKLDVAKNYVRKDEVGGKLDRLCNRIDLIIESIDELTKKVYSKE